MSDWELQMAVLRAEAAAARQDAITMSGDPELSEISIRTSDLLRLLDVCQASTPFSLRQLRRQSKQLS
jgi:hypothetical protein